MCAYITIGSSLFTQTDSGMKLVCMHERRKERRKKGGKGERNEGTKKGWKKERGQKEGLKESIK